MKKILCPTDFSAAAENAVTYAAKIAQRIGASVHLFHMDLLFDLTPEEALLDAGMSNLQVAEILEKECLEVSQVFKVSCYAEPITSGASLANSIATIAKGFDMVVMGTNGDDTFFQDIFGSNAFRVIKKTGIPVVIVPEKCDYSEIDHIAYAFDYWRVFDVPMQKIVGLAKELGCRLTVVQVMEAYSFDAETELRATESALKDIYSRDVALSFEVLYNDSITDALSGFMSRGTCDALAVCFREAPLKGVLFGGVIRKMIRETSYPLIVFH